MIEDTGVLAVIGAEVFVAVPIDAGFAEVSAVVELDAADAAFDEAAGHEAVVAEVAEDGIVQAVHAVGGGGFFREVSDFGSADLHAGGEFVAFDAGDERVLVIVFAGVAGVELGEEIVGGGLLGAGDLRGRFEIGDGFRLIAEDDALVGGGEEAVAPVGDAAGRESATIGEDDEGGEVLVFGAESVGDPGADGGEALEDEAGGHLEDGGSVGVGAGDHRVEEGEVVGEVAQVGQEIGDHFAGLAAGAEGPGGFHEGAAFSEERGDGVGALGFEAVVLGEIGFVVEGVDGRNSAGEEDHDEVLGLGGEVGVGSAEAGGGAGVAGEEVSEGESGGAAADFPEEFAARGTAGRGGAMGHRGTRWC